MAEAVITRIVVFDDALYHGNGDVVKWCTKITNRFADEARHYAPVRSGELVAGISGATHTIGRRQVEGIIESRAPHTMYVLRGTTGPIMTNKGWANPNGAWTQVWGWAKQGGGFTKNKGESAPGARRRQFPVRVKGYWMHVPATDDGGFKGGFFTEVSGQDANNFLLKAWRATARNHRAIRGPVPSFILTP